MRKNNLITLSVFIIMIAAVAVFASYSKKDDGKNGFNSAVSDINPADKKENEPSETLPPASEPTGDADSESVEPADMSDALFIGDSRTVGIMEYAGLNDADFFCSTGLSVFNINDDSVSVPKIGKVTLAKLLSCKKYGKIYVMLGINELGHSFEKIVDKYGELYAFIRKYQPDAAVFINANLHVTEKRSESDKYINNTAIDKLNAELKKLADNQNTFYLDVNPLFDDGRGNLAADKSADDAHLYAKHYSEWGNWLRSETAKLM